MPIITDRLGLAKPTDADEFVTEDWAANWQAIADSAAGWLPSNTLANRPAPSASIEGFLYWAYDDGQTYLCVDDGTGTHVWASLGVTDHAALSGREDADAHPDLFLEADHTKATHDAATLSAATLQGVPIEAMGAQLIHHDTAISSTNVRLTTTYQDVLGMTFNPPASWGTYRLSAHGMAWIRFGTGSAQARIEIGASIGTAVSIATDCAPSVSHSASGLSGTNRAALMAKGSEDPDLLARMLFFVAYRES